MKMTSTPSLSSSYLSFQTSKRQFNKLVPIGNSALFVVNILAALQVALQACPHSHNNLFIEYCNLLMSSPSKQASQSPPKYAEPHLRRQSTAGSQNEVSSKKRIVFPKQSGYQPPDGIILSKKTSDLGLLENEEFDVEEEQTTKVQMDLFRGIHAMAKSKQLQAIGGLGGAFMIHLIVGAIYRWNMINGYVGMFYGAQKESPMGGPLAMLCAGLTMRVGFKLSNSYGSAVVLGSAMVLATMASILSSYMSSISSFLFFHNVLYGLSAGLLFLPPIQQCHKFFPNLKLITNSIILTGTGLGAVLFGASNIECIEHDYQTQYMTDQQIQSMVNGNFSNCLLKMSLMVFLMGFIGIAAMLPMILRNEEQELQIRVEEKGNFCKSQYESFQSRVFWIVAIIIFLVSCGNYYIIGNFKNLLPPSSQSKTFLYWLLISGALGNGFSRIFWGFLFSRVGFKILFCVAAGLNLSAFIMIMATSDPTIYFVFYTLSCISLGGFMVMFPNVAQLIFGKKIGESIYSYYWVVFSLSNFFQLGITYLLTSNSSTYDDYSEILFFFTFCVIGSIVLVCREKLQGGWNNSLDLVEFKRVPGRKNSH